MDTLLPYENPEHPLHTSNYQPDEDWSDEDLGYGLMCGDPTKTPAPMSKREQRRAQERENVRQGMIGPNYARPMGAKPAEYKRWGNKWYKKSK